MACIFFQSVSHWLHIDNFTPKMGSLNENTTSRFGFIKAKCNNIVFQKRVGPYCRNSLNWVAHALHAKCYPYMFSQHSWNNIYTGLDIVFPRYFPRAQQSINKCRSTQKKALSIPSVQHAWESVCSFQ